MTLTEDFYDFEYHAEGAAASVLLVVIFLLYNLSTVFAVLQYVLQSVGMYTIAKRRAIRHPWLSWLPFGNLWILGCISDQYQYVTKGNTKNARKVLLVLSLLPGILGLAIMVGWGSLLFGFLAQSSEAATILATVLRYLGLLLLLAIVSVVLTVFTYKAQYDLYASCDPGKAVLFLILSIFIPVLIPFFVFCCRKKELGMPPRKTQPIQEETAAESPDFWENDTEE